MSLLAMGFFFGVLTHLISPVQGEGPLGVLAGFVMRGADGLFLISIPAILSAFTVTLIRKELKLRTSLFISLVCSLVYVLFYALALTGGGAGITPDVLFVGYGLAFIVWYVVSRIFFGLHWYTSFLLAIIQLVYNASFLLFNKAVLVSTDPGMLVFKLYLSSFAFLAALYAVFWLIDAPMKRNFGVSGVEAASLFMAQWMAQSKGLEELFQRVGEEVETYVAVMAFRKKQAEKQKECLFVVPCVHYGPFGNLGGSEYPHLIAQRLWKERGAETFVFHGTATHDFNPVATEEIEPLLAGCRSALEKMTFEKAKGAFVFGKAGTCRATCIIANGNCFIGLTRAPRTTEDVDFSLGISTRYLVLSMGMKEAAVVDEHNSETGEITRVHMGDPVGFEYMDSVEAALRVKFKPEQMKLGIHTDDLSRVAEGSVGKAGLKTAVFQVGRELHAILLFDANGIRPGFRRRIIDSVRELGIEAEVYTTDTHCINAVSGVLNPLGSSNEDEFIRRVLHSVELARDDLSEVEVGMRTERVKIKVFGTQQSSELLGTINSIVAVAKVAVPIVFIVTAIFVLWAITKVRF